MKTLRRRGYRFNGKLIKNEHSKSQIGVEPQVNEPASTLEFPAKIIDKIFAEKSSLIIPSDKRRLAAVAFVVLLVGAVGLGYYFFQAGKTAPGADGTKSIAVLPLKSINTANRDEIYEIGIADSLIHRLNSMKGFVVRPLSAVRKYGNVDQDPLAAGREQQVDYVLASNYQLANGRIRITAQLIDVKRGLVEETYKSEKDAAEVFVMQDAIAGEIGNMLVSRFALTASGLLAKRGTTNEEAYRLYLHASNLVGRTSLPAARESIESFDEAIRLDPNFARAYSGLARSHIDLANLVDDPFEDCRKARDAVRTALELNNNLSEGYQALGLLEHRCDWDFDRAERDMRRAIQLEPYSDSAHSSYAWYLNSVGRSDDAIAEINTALEINPGSAMYQMQHGIILYFARRYDDAITKFKPVIESSPGLAGYGWIWLACSMKGDNAQAFEWFIQSESKNQGKVNHEEIEEFRAIYEASGWNGIRVKQLEIEKADPVYKKGRFYRIARISTLIGEKEQAFEYLNKAIERRDAQLLLLNHEPAFDALRGDPRFDEMVRRIGFK